MTIRTQAERVLFAEISTRVEISETENETAETSTNVDKPDVIRLYNVSLPKAEKLAAKLPQVKPTRRRVNATYCPICAGWVEVRLQPVRLRCTRCGVEARP